MLIQQFIKKYNPNNIALDDTELKMLKSKFQPNQVINENELGDHFLKGIYCEEITQIIVSNHLIYDSNIDLFELAYNLKHLVNSLNTQIGRAHV